MKKKCFPKKKSPPPPPPEFFFNITPNYYFLNVGNSIKHEENKIQTTFHHIKNYTAHPHDMVHEWTDRQTDGQTDRQTDGGHCNISRPGPSAPREIKIQISKSYI